MNKQKSEKIISLICSSLIQEVNNKETLSRDEIIALINKTSKSEINNISCSHALKTGKRIGKKCGVILCTRHVQLKKPVELKLEKM